MLTEGGTKAKNPRQASKYGKVIVWYILRLWERHLRHGHLRHIFINFPATQVIYMGKLQSDKQRAKHV